MRRLSHQLFWIPLLLLVMLVHAQVPTQPRALLRTFKIEVNEPAFTGLPIWVHADLPEDLKAHYPYQSQNLAAFGLNRLELKCDDQPVTPRQWERLWPVSSTGPASACGETGLFVPASPTNRLPLHLQYSPERTGSCSVRWIVYRNCLIVAQSEWTSFELRQSTPEQIDKWLSLEIAKAPTEPGLVVGDYLPSLLAVMPDVRVLRAVLDQMYSESELVQSTALHAVQAFPRDLPAEAFAAIRRHGISDSMAYLLSWNGPSFQQARSDVVRVAVSQLGSSKHQEPAAALKVLGFLVHLDDTRLPKPDPALTKWADEQVLRASPSLIQGGDTGTLQQLAVYLGSTRSETARDPLWKIADRSGKSSEQALIALCWIADRRDLSRIAAWLIAPGDATGVGYERASLPYHLVRAYGGDADPYLLSALTKSPYMFVRTSAGEELAARGRSEAYRYMLDIIERNPADNERGRTNSQEPGSEKRELLRWLHERFPKEVPPQAGDAAAKSFLNSRLTP